MKIGGHDGIPISQVVSYTDHITDVANDARIPVSLHGWILPEVLDDTESVSHVYEEPSDWDDDAQRERVAVQLFEKLLDQRVVQLGTWRRGIVFGEGGTYRFRVRSDGPIAPTNGMDTFTLVPDTLVEGTDYIIEHIASNLVDIIMIGAEGAPVPDFQLLGARLQNFRTIEAWTSDDVVEEDATRFSRYLYRLREFQYGGYTSIALSDAQALADWVVRYYRRGIKTITLQLFASEHVLDAFRLWPDGRTPVVIQDSYYRGGAPQQWLVRSRRHVFRDGHMWTELTLDEDIMHSLA